MKTKQAKASDRQYVNHPRYGCKPRPSKQKFSLAEILRAHWSYRAETVFPETAIAADIDKQNFAIYPRLIYVDIAKVCRVCHRWFIFFAAEQKYWFETLGMYVDADCVKCISCRQQEQDIKAMLAQYQRLLKQPQRSETETKTLRKIALELFQQGYIRNKNKIDAIR